MSVQPLPAPISRISQERVERIPNTNRELGIRNEYFERGGDKKLVD